MGLEELVVKFSAIHGRYVMLKHAEVLSWGTLNKHIVQTGRKIG